MIQKTLLFALCVWALISVVVIVDYHRQLDACRDVRPSMSTPCWAGGECRRVSS
jgi:hypothetical protein